MLPTIADYWRDRINSAHTLTELQALHQELSEYKILDPACGSGNFLYVAYQELKSVEFDLLQSLQGLDPSQEYMSLVTPQQFFGMDINSFAVELAKVTLMIGRGVAIRKLNLPESSLPLDTLDQNIVCKDALFTDWVKADAIIGNPPFFGGEKLRQELGDEYVEKVYQKFPEVKGQPDFCVFWFRKASDLLGDKDKGRAGLVATNSISQVSGREASLEYVVNNGGIIYEAVSTQEWSGDAVVHVSIVNWAKEQPKQRLLDSVLVPFISSSLKNEISVTSAVKLKANSDISFEGCKLIGKGFVLSEDRAIELIKANESSRTVLKPMIDGRGLIYPFEKLDWVIDFNDMSIEEASIYKEVFQVVRQQVKPERDNNRNQKTRDNWWLFERARPAMRKALVG